MDIMLKEPVGIKIGVLEDDSVLRVTLLWPVKGMKRKMAIQTDSLLYNNKEASSVLNKLRNAEDDVKLMSYDGGKFHILNATQGNGVESKKVLAILADRGFLLEGGSIVHLPTSSPFKNIDEDLPYFENALEDFKRIGYDDCGRAVMFDVYKHHVLSVYYDSCAADLTTLNKYLSSWGHYGADYAERMMEVPPVKIQSDKTKIWKEYIEKFGITDEGTEFIRLSQLYGTVDFFEKLVDDFLEVE